MDKINPNELNSSGFHIIFDAINDTDIPRLNALVEGGADLEVTWYNGKTPALYAAFIDQWDACLYLVQNDANIMAADRFGATIVFLAYYTQIPKDTYQGSYLTEFLKYIEENDLGYLDLEPKVVLEMIKQDEWPPLQPEQTVS